jgi:SAM-dependent methyltransferase
MLTDPTRHSGSIPFRPGRLVVQHMDGRSLRFEDNTFDFIYSCSSIEHFGEAQDVAQAAKEMARVLKPGGLIAISTELCVKGEPGRLNRSTLLFSAQQIKELIVEPSGCIPVDQPDYTVSSSTLAKRTNFRLAASELDSTRPRLQHRCKLLSNAKVLRLTAALIAGLAFYLIRGTRVPITKRSSVTTPRVSVRRRRGPWRLLPLSAPLLGLRVFWRT